MRGLGVEDSDQGAFLVQHASDIERESVADVIGVRLEGRAERGDPDP